MEEKRRRVRTEEEREESGMRGTYRNEEKERKKRARETGEGTGMKFKD